MDYCMDNGVCKDGLEFTDGVIMTYEYCIKNHKKWLRDNKLCCLNWSDSDMCK